MGCERCGDGHGWIHPTEAEAEKRFPMPQRLAMAQLGDDLTDDDEREVERIMLRREQVVESVYPCPSCRLAQFIVYRDGHYHPDHDRLSCEECQTVGRR